MFISYLKDMKSWILFFLLSLGFADVFIWLDQGIDAEFSSVLYFNVLLIIFFIYLLSGGIERNEVHERAFCTCG